MSNRNIPPAQRAERALLGAMLTDPKVIDQVQHMLAADDFDDPHHASAWNAILHVATDPSVTVDALLVVDHLRKTGNSAGINALHLFEWMQDCPVPGNARAYAAQVRDASALRTARNLGVQLTGIADSLTSDDATALIDTMKHRLDEVAQHLGEADPLEATGLHDLSWVLTGPPPPVEQPTWGRRLDGPSLFYPGRVNGLFGEPESGKTWVALQCIVEVLAAGKRAAFIDVDHNGSDLVTQRLELLGAQDKHVGDRGCFRYYTPQDAQHLRASIQHVARWNADLVVMDSVGEMLAMLGAKSIDNDEVTTALRSTAGTLAATGACVITIDHLPKSGLDRSQNWAIGASAKKAFVDGAYYRVQLREQFVPGGRGVSGLHRAKDRLGQVTVNCLNDLAGNFVLDGTAGGTASFIEPPTAATARQSLEAAVEAAMAKVSDVLEKSGPHKKADLERAVGGKATTTRTAVTRLQEGGHVRITQGPNRSQIHELVRPYPEARGTSRDPAPHLVPEAA